MNWKIDHISSKEESVFLIDESTGIKRKISIPGAEDALMSNNKLFIKAKTGYLWEVMPSNGSRRRFNLTTKQHESRDFSQWDLSK